LNTHSFTRRLSELARFVEATESLEESLSTLARLVSEAMDCGHCSIMLIKRREEDDAPVLRVEAHHGALPDEALQTPLSLDSGIAGHVATTGEPLLIHDLHRSAFASAARREPSGSDDVISVPILLEDAVVGVINIDSPQGRDGLGVEDLNMATILALAVAQSLRIHRLQGLLNTQFMQSILARVPDEAGKAPAGHVHTDPERLVRVIAHTLFREMKRVGFAGDHILALATELIARVSDNRKRKHRKGDRFI
jgi:signal transduction protein with GAF and PtsI domain